MQHLRYDDVAVNWFCFRKLSNADRVGTDQIKQITQWRKEIGLLERSLRTPRPSPVSRIELRPCMVDGIADHGTEATEACLATAKGKKAMRPASRPQYTLPGPFMSCVLVSR